MIIHFGVDLPQPKATHLDHEALDLTPEEARIIKEQIRKNARSINEHIERLDLFVNKEKYPHKEAFLNKIRNKLYLLMDENDTFRKVLWKHTQQMEGVQFSQKSH